MNNFLKSLFLFVLFCFSSLLSFAQGVEMADQFRQEGKIYVVLAVIAIILIVFFFLLFRVDRKIKDLEDQIKNIS